MATDIFQTPFAFISLVESDRVWFKSHRGTSVSEIRRDESLCARVIEGAGVLVIPDLRVDYPGNYDAMGLLAEFRFYAGAPLRTLDRQNLGAVCVLDTQPRNDWDNFKTRVLEDLAAITVDEMELRRMSAGRAREFARTERIMTQVGQQVWVEG